MMCQPPSFGEVSARCPNAQQQFKEVKPVQAQSNRGEEAGLFDRLLHKVVEKLGRKLKFCPCCGYGDLS
jgi:hypothetical protein